MSRVDERYVFSDVTRPIYEGVVSRNDDARIVQGLFNRLPDDGKTPFEDVFEQNPNAPYVICLAKAIVESWMSAEAHIFDSDILLGYPRPERPITARFCWGIECEGELSDRAMALKDRMFPADYSEMHAEGVRRMGEEAYNAAKDSRLWSTGGYQGHTIPSYEKLLSMGIGGVIRQIDEYDALCSDPEKKDFYEACRIIMKGMSKWILRLADAADALALETGEKQLHAAAENARKVSLDAPVDMYGACQLTWFYSLWDEVDSMGRTDYYLMPFYKGHEDDDYAAALMFKMWEHGVHDVTVGGQNPDGSDSTNDLSYLLLQIFRTVHDTHPRMTLRIHDGTPRDIIELMVAMWSEGLSDPTVAGDDTVIGGLVEYGVPIEDARGYSVLGCQEVEIPGKSNFGCEDGSINLAKILELTLNHGRDRFNGAQIGLDLGGTEDFKTFDELWAAFEAEIDYLLPIFIDLCNLGVDIRVKNVAKLVKSTMTEACIERGLNLDAGGAVYNFGVAETAGSAAVADALYAVKTLVYDEGVIDLFQLEAALSANYEGFEDVRRLFLNAPKFGNNDEGADEMACRVLNMFWDKLRRFNSGRGQAYTGACALLTGGIHYGEETWALPDGRFAGEALGNTIGPRTGSDKNGLTAMLTSVAKLPLKKGVGGTTCNVMIPGELMKTEELRGNIVSLMKTFVKMGGQLAQVTTASKEELIDAKENPTGHEGLIVRVGGYSTKFIQLDGKYQDEIIARYAE